MAASCSPSPDRPEASSPALTLLTPPTNSLFKLPENISSLRMRLFTVDSKIIMSQAEFDAIWPFVDNLYTPNRIRTGITRPHRKVTYYRCRLYNPNPHQSKVPQDQRQRKRTIRTPTGCPCRAKVVSDGKKVTFERTGKDGHNHHYSDLESKLSSAVRNLAAEEFAKGYRPMEIVRMLRNPRNGNLEALQLAGGAGLTNRSVHNAGASWAKTQSAPNENATGLAVLHIDQCSGESCDDKS